MTQPEGVVSAIDALRQRAVWQMSARAFSAVAACATPALHGRFFVFVFVFSFFVIVVIVVFVCRRCRAGPPFSGVAGHPRVLVEPGLRRGRHAAVGARPGA
jgi:hypothetical protein